MFAPLPDPLVSRVLKQRRQCANKHRYQWTQLYIANPLLVVNPSRVIDMALLLFTLISESSSSGSNLSLKC